MSFNMPCHWKNVLYLVSVPEGEKFSKKKELFEIL